MEFTVREQKAINYAANIIKKKANNNDFFTSSQSVQDYLFLRLAPEKKEVFRVLFLNSQNQLISDEVLFTGTINQAPVFPREILRRALTLNASAIILAHNHPSGIAEPSSADRAITNLIVEGMNLLDVRVLDHIIVGSRICYSFAEHGLI